MPPAVEEAYVDITQGLYTTCHGGGLCARPGYVNINF